MKKIILSLFVALFVSTAFSGGAGVVIKGALKTWDDIARVALKRSGRKVTDDAVNVAAQTLEKAAHRYGDDVVEASFQFGMESAEQALRRGNRFAKAISRAAETSDDAVRTLVLHADDLFTYVPKYGDAALDVGAKAPGLLPRMTKAIETSGIGNSKAMMSSFANLPPKDLTRVLGAVEKNPSVAKEFLQGVRSGGTYFVDKIFALNGRQILAGGLSSAMIAAALRVTKPFQEVDGKSASKTFFVSSNIIAVGIALSLIIVAFSRIWRPAPRTVAAKSEGGGKSE